MPERDEAPLHFQLPREPPGYGCLEEMNMQQSTRAELLSSYNGPANFPPLGMDRSKEEFLASYFSVAGQPSVATMAGMYNDLQGTDPLPSRPSTNDLQLRLPQNHPRDQTAEQSLEDNISFRIETKQVFACTYGACNNKYTRLQDLRRHHRGAHQGNHQFKCRASKCERAIRGFSRRDKRDSHEKSMHAKRGEGRSG